MKPNADRAKELTAQIPGYEMDSNSHQAQVESGIASEAKVRPKNAPHARNSEDSARSSGSNMGSAITARPGESAPVLRLHDYARALWILAMKLEALLR